MERRKVNTVWIVEDNALFASFIEKVIQNQFPCEIKKYFSGKELIKGFAKEEYPDVLVLDYWLPDTTANEIMDLLEELDIECPVVILSGETDEEIIEHVKERGAFNFILKQRDDMENLVEDLDILLKTIDLEKLGFDILREISEN